MRSFKYLPLSLVSALVLSKLYGIVKFEHEEINDLIAESSSYGIHIGDTFTTVVDRIKIYPKTVQGRYYTLMLIKTPHS